MSDYDAKYVAYNAAGARLSRDLWTVSEAIDFNIKHPNRAIFTLKHDDQPWSYRWNADAQLFEGFRNIQPVITKEDVNRGEEQNG